MSSEDLAARVAALENTVAVLAAQLAHQGDLSARAVAVMRQSVADRKRHGVAPGLSETRDLLPDIQAPTAEIRAYRRRS